MLIDAFTFFDELDIAEIRMHEMDAITDKFIVLEAGETYGGKPKPYNFENNAGRFENFKNKIIYVKVPKLIPICMDRTTGRLREKYQRDMILPAIKALKPPPDAVISLSDCDEIPRATAITENINKLNDIHRLKQESYYYNCQCQVDYGHDWASRARIGLVSQLEEIGSIYDFRMYKKDICPAIENGGWHFSYFGGVQKVKRKVAALSPFLQEYKLFGDDRLYQDILNRKDLHHRDCELPKTFSWLPFGQSLPRYLAENLQTKFPHFTEKHIEQEYIQQLKGGHHE